MNFKQIVTNAVTRKIVYDIVGPSNLESLSYTLLPFFVVILVYVFRELL